MRHRLRNTLRILVTTLLLAPALCAFATPKLFRAEYKASYNGLPVRATGVRELTKLESGDYVMVSSARAFFATIREQTRFTLADEGGTVIPTEYRYDRTGLGKNRTAVLTFDWTAKQVRNDVQKQPWLMAIDTGTQDKLSYQLQMRADLAAAWQRTREIPDFSYKVADGGTMKTYVFRVVGEEQVITPAGEFATVRLTRVRDGSDRLTHFWLAPDHDFMLVRFEQQEDDGDEFKLILTSFEFERSPNL